MDLFIQHNETTREFFAIVEGKKSTLNYNRLQDGKTLDYYSTFVPEALRGHQIAAKIVKHALEYAKKEQYKVIPTCHFVKSYIDRHPEYQSLIL